MSKPELQQYYILDKGMRYVGGIRLTPGQETVDCTESEARFFLENGGLSCESPKDLKAKAKAAREEAEAEKAEAAGDAPRETVPEPAAETAPVAGDAMSVVEPADKPVARQQTKGR